MTGWPTSSLPMWSLLLAPPGAFPWKGRGAGNAEQILCGGVQLPGTILRYHCGAFFRQASKYA
jgi:hypothetical protein